MFLGIVDRSDEIKVVAAEGNVVKARSFKRVEPLRRAAPEILEKLQAFPWRPQPDNPDLDQIPITSKLDASPVVDAAELPQPPPLPRGPTVHRFHIRKDRELKTYGFTPGCLGC